MKRFLLLLATVVMIFTACEGSLDNEENGSMPLVPEIIISTKELNFPAKGGKQEISITANFEYEVSEKVDWLSIEQIETGLLVKVNKSDSVENRYAYIIITSKEYEIEEVITVSQVACEPKLEIETTSLILDYKGDERTINITSNIEYNIRSTAEWLIIKKVTKGISITILPNYIMTPRSTSIIISSVKHNLEKKISITQTTMPSDYTIIEYTTDFGGIVKPYNTNAFGDAQIVSNTYENGMGVLKFDIPLTTIGYQAFSNSLLTSITIPDGVTSIGNEAFRYCTSLKSVTIPNSVTSIGDYAFSDCASLTSVTIPNSVTSIGDYAFSDCASLTSVTILDSVTSIGTGAFFGCISLTNITIPNSVTSIEDSAFCKCSSLTSVTIGNGITSIGERAFAGCTSLTRVNISDLSAWCRIDFGDNSANPLLYTGILHLNGSELTDITIPSDIIEIKDSAFYRCTSLTSVTIPDSVTSIGSHAFDYCTLLKSVTIGHNVTSIGARAFAGCTSLTSIYCKPITPPGIYYNYNGFENGSFPFNPEMVIFVYRNSYNEYMQNSTYIDRYITPQNWYKYELYIKPYDFE